MKILACIDGSAYADNICCYASWAALRLNAEVNLLHVLRRHSDYHAPAEDHTGTIGLGARTSLLTELTKMDEERARLDQEKGKLVLHHGKKLLRNEGLKDIQLTHRRGSLVDTIKELEDESDLIFIGKRGEHADPNSMFLGSNLEKVARSVHKPLFVVSSVLKTINSFVIAYDGRENAEKAVEFVTNSPLLKSLECHLLVVESKDGEMNTTKAEVSLRDAGFEVQTTKLLGKATDELISNFIKTQEIGLLLTGAYSHSRVRSIFLGSTTASLITKCKIPLLLFR
ncbi:MAG TPA: universal stress protein [Vampirovibrionales bacterium]